jgi:hypothetical protein
VSADTEPRVGGAIVFEQIKVMRELFGDEAVDKAMASLAPEMRAEFDEILPVSWCAARSFTALKTAVARQAKVDPIRLHKKVVEVGIIRTLSMWRVLIRQASDEFLIRKTRLIWTKTFDRGDVTAKIVGPGRAEIVVKGWNQIPDFDAEGVASGIESILKVAGRKDVHVIWERQLGGARFIAMWRV